MSDVDILEEIKVEEKNKQLIKEPTRYKVVILNDDTTPMEFVIDVLKLVFSHSAETAKQLTLQIHTEGSGIAGIYSYEIAEQKSVECTTISRQQGFPLQVRIETNE